MCLYERTIKNKKYVANKKNGGNIPIMKDKRAQYVPVACGRCMECRKKESREWQVRLNEEIRHDQTGKFVTLTFNDKALNKLGKLTKKKGYEKDNEIAKIAVKRFLERWRQKNKKSVKHWLVTELGQTGTERLHLHGIIWTNETKDIIEKWKYGHVWIGEYVNEKTVNYIVKYLNKQDLIHKEYKPIKRMTKGLGKQYLERSDSKRNKYKNDGETKETYKTRQGYELGLPTYYRKKIYSDEEREKLWMQKLDKGDRYVNGVKTNGEKDHEKTLEQARKLNKLLNYGDNTFNYERWKAENDRRNTMKLEQIKEKYRN